MKNISVYQIVIVHNQINIEQTLHQNYVSNNVIINILFIAVINIV